MTSSAAIDPQTGKTGQPEKGQPETGQPETGQPETGRRAGLAATGGLLGAVAASSCCIVPLALFSAGISGAWIGNLTALAPYQPVFAAVALGFLGYGYYLAYRKPKAACAGDAACARPLPNRVVKLSLWSASVLLAAAIAFPYVAPLFLPT